MYPLPFVSRNSIQIDITDDVDNITTGKSITSINTSRTGNNSNDSSPVVVEGESPNQIQINATNGTAGLNVNDNNMKNNNNNQYPIQEWQFVSSQLEGNNLAGTGTGAGADNSTGLARLLSRGSSGSGDNGIDIHIHAIVTAPGASPGGMGIATIGSSGRSPTANLGGARNSISSNWSSTGAGGGGALHGNSLSSTDVDPTDEEDYADLFSELYSENPNPIDPNSSLGRGREESHATGNSQATANSPTRSQNGNESANNYSSTILNDEHGFSDDQSLRTSSGRNRRSGVLRGLFRRRGSRNNNGHNEET
mmetsp:Transcript_53244/g.60595  ORF Transcript_53244/g.60595 Transcript_53244/m.60595 type:complete len:309 (-) Transcript_53244:109-1035(-)